MKKKYFTEIYYLTFNTLRTNKRIARFLWAFVWWDSKVFIHVYHMIENVVEGFELDIEDFGRQTIAQESKFDISNLTKPWKVNKMPFLIDLLPKF